MENATWTYPQPNDSIMKLLMSYLTFLLTLHASATLTVRGTLVDHENRPTAGTVVIYEGNMAVDTVSIDDSGRFRVPLPNHVYYTLEFQSTGYVHKRIAADTREAPLQGRPRKYSCTVALVPEKQEYEHAGWLDFPVAVLYYSVKGGFSYGKSYTREIHQLYATLMQ